MTQRHLHYLKVHTSCVMTHRSQFLAKHSPVTIEGVLRLPSVVGWRESLCGNGVGRGSRFRT